MCGEREGSMQPGREGDFVRVSKQIIERAHARMRKNDSEGESERKRKGARKDRRKGRRTRKRQERKRKRARVGESRSE